MSDFAVNQRTKWFVAMGAMASMLALSACAARSDNAGGAAAGDAKAKVSVACSIARRLRTALREMTP